MASLVRIIRIWKNSLQTYNIFELLPIGDLNNGCTRTLYVVLAVDPIPSWLFIMLEADKKSAHAICRYTLGEHEIYIKASHDVHLYPQDMSRSDSNHSAALYPRWVNH